MADTFVLNTANMDEAAKSCQTLADQMQAVKTQMDTLQSVLSSVWAGDGHNEFQKQFRLLRQQLSDITDNLYQTGEEIITAEEAYIQADTDAAKSIDGVQQGVLDNADEYLDGILKDTGGTA